MIQTEEHIMLSRPRLILVTQWFDPEPTFKGLVFARALRDRGFDVEVVTGFPNYPGGKIYQGYKVRPIQRENIDGIHITRLALYPSHSRSAFARSANYISFAMSVFIYMTFFIRRSDIIYAYHPPLTASLAVLLAQIIRRTPVVLDIQDMWPDTISVTGMVKTRHLIRLIAKTCRWIYSRACHIVVLSPGFKRLLLDRGVSEKKITVIYNWADEDAISSSSKIRPALMPDDSKFRVLFAGNLGLAQNLDIVLDAAKIVAVKNEKVRICFLGDGLDSERLQQRVLDEKISNVDFFPKVPMAAAGAYLLAADSLLVNLCDDPLFEVTIPSKTQAYMKAARPIIIAVRGDAAALVTEANAGIAVPPEDAIALADAILKMSSLSVEERHAFSQSAENYYDSHLSVARGVDHFSKLFHSILN